MDNIIPLTFENNSYKLVIAADKMNVLLWLKSTANLSETEEVPTYKDIMKILSSHGVLFGLKQKELTDGLNKLIANTKPGMIVAAEGDPTINGTQFNYKFIVPMARPAIDDWLETGSVDMIIRSQEPVKKGMIILDIDPGIKGHEGVNVLGETIPFLSFPIIRVQAGLHVRSQNNRRFVADVDGYIQIEKNYISIIPFEEMYVHTEISADEMEATIWFEKDGLHTIPPTRDSVLETLRFAGINACIDVKAIEEAVKYVKAGSYSNDKIKIAQGRPPMEGHNATIHFNFNIDPNKVNLLPDIYTFDPNHDSLFHKESIVAVKSKMVMSQDGQTVTKKTLMAKPVEDISIMTENFFLNREDRKENKILFVNSVGGNVSFRGTTLFLKPYQDASVEFTTEKNLLRLLVSFHPAIGGGKQISFEEITEKLADEGFVYGIKEEAIRSTAVKCQKDETPILNILCAEGDAPNDGEDSKLRLFFKTTADMILGEEINIDFKKRDTIPYIGKDAVAAEIIQPTLGRNGKDIKGEPIKATDGILNAPKTGPNIREESGRYYTNIEGWPIYKDNLLNVLPYFETEGNVDYSTGNISFPGTVMVKGDVLPGFSVAALKGDLIVKGNATDAKLKASGNIIISGGAKKADITCEGDFTVKFIEYCKARAKGNITILGSAIADYLLSGGDITMLKGKGTVIAGKTLACGTITVLNAGNDVAIETILMAGEDFFTRNKLAHITKMGRDMAEQNKEFQLTLQNLESIPSDTGQGQLIALKTKIRVWTHQIARLERMKLGYDELISKAHSAEKGKIIVKNTIFHGSIVSIKNAVIKINSDQKTTEFTFNWESNKIVAERIVSKK